MNKAVKFSGKNARPGSDFNSGAYYRRYYFNPATRVTSAAEMRDRMAPHPRRASPREGSGAPVLDAGCGVGLLRRPFASLAPRIAYTELEDSDYLCKRYGWTRGSLVDFKARLRPLISWSAMTCCST